MTQMIAHKELPPPPPFSVALSGGPFCHLEGGQGGDALKDPRPPPISRFAAQGEAAAAAAAPAGDGGGCGDIDLRRGSSRLLDGN